MTIAITGATGHLGRLIISGLASRIPAGEIIALARSPEKAADLGVAVRSFDYDRQESLVPSLTGVGTLLLISANEIGKRALQHRHVINAAKQAGVSRIVYTSLLHADTSPLSLAAEHSGTEAAIKASAIPFTFLRNGWYAENYTGSIGGALAGGAFMGSAGAGKISAAARADYAEAAVVALTSAGQEGKTYELAGDTAWTLSDLAAEVSRQTGRTIPYRDLPESDYATALAGIGLPEGLAKAIAGWDVAASQGALFDDARQLSTLIGRPTTPLSQSVAEAVAALTPAA
jgi:NAD(P)H dehydrogenase (quinone)